MVWKLRVISLVFLSYFVNLSLVTCQSGDSSQTVNVIVLVNGQEVSITVAPFTVPFITELAEEIIRVTSANATFDVNECRTESIHNCTQNETCINLEQNEGFFRCACAEGFIRINGTCVEDLCLTMMNLTCNEASRQCNNDVSAGLACDCAPGYTEVNGTCQIITLCFPNRCPIHSVCTQTSQTNFSCTCNGNGGYEMTGGQMDETIRCEDIDECARNTSSCDPMTETCMNTDGSYTCSCQTGYTGTVGNCMDIDECATGTHDCNANANCTNTMGSFTCKCQTGYSGNGTTCEGRGVAKAKLLFFSSRYVPYRYQRAPNGQSTSMTISTQSINLKIVELSDTTVSNRSITENS